MKYNSKKIIHNLSQFLKDVGPFLLAHHPLCSYFEDHVITVRGHKLCMGCTFLLPSFFLSLFIFMYTDLLVLLSITYRIILALGLMSCQLSSLIEFKKSQKKFKIILKALTGIGFAILTSTIFILTLNFYLKIIILGIIYYSTVGAWGYHTLKHLTVTCQACDYHGNWKVCDGFRDIYKKLLEHNFIVEKELKKD